MSTEAVRAAGELSPAQRAALLNAAPKGFGHGNSFYAVGRANTKNALFDRGMVQYTGRLTAFGLAVREILKGRS